MSYSFEDITSELNESKALYSLASSKPKFIVDAQLPKVLSDFLIQEGYDSKHTLELPEMNRTKDSTVITISGSENRILISKDDDFLQSYLVNGKPAKLILVKTGNISNKDLLMLFQNGLDVIIRLIKQHSMIEITSTELIVHK